MEVERDDTRAHLKKTLSSEREVFRAQARRRSRSTAGEHSLVLCEVFDNDEWA